MQALANLPLAILAVVWFTSVMLYIAWAVEECDNLSILMTARKTISKSVNESLIEAVKQNPGAKMGMYMNIPVMYVRRDFLPALYGLNGERRN